MKRTVSVTEAKADLGSLVEEVRSHRTAIAVTMHRSEAAYIIDTYTYEHLREIEDSWLAAKLRERLSSEGTRPLKDVIEDLGLDK